MVCKWIIGAGAPLDLAYDICRSAHPELHVEKISVPQSSNYEFELDMLDALRPASGTAFAAFDERFGNFKRMELMSALMERGFQLESLISPRAMLATGVQVGPNALICDGVTIGSGSRIDYNTVLLPGTHVGTDTHIRPSCWIETGVIVGNSVQIGSHCTLRSGTLIAHGIQVGRHCDLGWPQRYDKNVAPKTIFDFRYDAPIYTYES